MTIPWYGLLTWKPPIILLFMAAIVCFIEGNAAETEIEIERRQGGDQKDQIEIKQQAYHKLKSYFIPFSI